MDAKVHRTRNIQNNPYLDTSETAEYQKERDRKAARELRQIAHKRRTVRLAASVNSRNGKGTNSK